MKPDKTIRIETVEMHTGGEPVRIVVSGYPPILGATLLDKRRYAKAELDAFRRLVMFEPRGHADMYGVLPVAPDHGQADMAVLFIHNEGYSTMCGHATLALGRYAVDRGLVRPEGDRARLRLQCPCGLVEVDIAMENGKAGRVAFLSVPAFAFALDREVAVPGHGSLRLDIGYGGAFYAILPASRLGLDLTRDSARDLAAAASAITAAAKAAIPLTHPEDADLAFLYGTILTDGGDGAGEASRNVCVFAEAEIDRSPTGSGVTARLALMLAKGEVALGETRRFASLTGAEFSGRILSKERAGDFSACRVEVSGRSYYTGSSVFTLETDDPLAGGFLLR